MLAPFRSICVAATTCLGLASAPAFAAPVYDTDALLTGSRSTGGGGLGFAAFAGTGFSASIAWSITPIAGGYQYRYEFDTPTGTGSTWNALSHFVLDLSDNCTAVGSCFQNLQLAYGTGPLQSATPVFGTYDSSIGNSNPFMPGTIVGAKFADGALPLTIVFDSDRVPGGATSTSSRAIRAATIRTAAIRTASRSGTWVSRTTHPRMCWTSSPGRTL